MKRYGFSIHDDNAQNSQGVVYPQDLHDQHGFASLAELLNKLGNTEKDLARVKADDDRDVVDSLWVDE
jgi:hypothetical protein